MHEKMSQMLRRLCLSEVAAERVSSSCVSRSDIYWPWNKYVMECHTRWKACHGRWETVWSVTHQGWEKYVSILTFDVQSVRENAWAYSQPNRAHITTLIQTDKLICYNLGCICALIHTGKFLSDDLSIGRHWQRAKMACCYGKVDILWPITRNPVCFIVQIKIKVQATFLVQM